MLKKGKTKKYKAVPRRRRKIRWDNVIGLGLFVGFLCMVGFGASKILRSTMMVNRKMDQVVEVDVEVAEEVPQYIVFLDPGHGAIDNGTSNGINHENEIVMEVARYVEANLPKEYEIHFSRENNEEVSWDEFDEKADLQTRINMAIQKDADVFVSIHVNYLDDYAYGMEVWHSEQSASTALAKAVESQLGQLPFIENRGLRSTSQSSLYVIDRNPITGVLIELGFLSNPDDLAYLTSKKQQAIMGEAIAKAIMQAYPLS